MNKTKIICTLGPASNTREIFIDLLKNGLNIVRLNLSHRNEEGFTTDAAMIRSVSKEFNTPVPILLDTRGPEIRTLKFENNGCMLETGKKVTICYDNILGNSKKFAVNYSKFHEDVKVGCTVLIDDGLIELEVAKIVGEEVICVVKNGGFVKNFKGINVPNISLQLPILSERDQSDILVGIKEDVDFIAASFVRNAADVKFIRSFLKKHGGENIKIISKIESQGGVDNIDEIISISDGIMVARGDLGVETAAESIPIIQKQIVKKCNEAEVPVIIATQMLDSMISNPRPTRAEVSDVANAVLDGTDCIMLSGETAAGKYPIESVSTMRKIADSCEEQIHFRTMSVDKRTGITGAVSYATCSTANSLNAHAIICPTFSGRTAKLISMFRPSMPIIATTVNPKVERQMMLCWGVIPILMKQETSSDILFYKSVQEAKRRGFLKSGDHVVITAGVPLGVAGNTNLMKIQEVD